MTRSIKAMIGLVAAATLAGLSGSAQAGWDKTKDAAADSLLGGVVSPQIPSVAACIAIDGVPVFQKSFGQMSPGVGASPKTIYRIGSLSKQFTAAAILALIEDGAKAPDGSTFGLQSNVSLFFDGVEGWSKPRVPMTVKRLLTMTSNLPNYTDSPPPGLDTTQPVKAADLLNGILKFKPTSFVPAYGYANTNYFLLASIIDQLTSNTGRRPVGGFVQLKSDYRAYLRKRIFARAGMTATNFIDDPKPLGDMATPTVGPGASFANPSWPKGAGAIQSNVIDLCLWDTALVKGKVLSAASVATMGTPGSPATGNPPSSYAMGWGITQFPNVLEYSHGGNIPGYTAVNLIEFYGGTHFISVVILTNGDQVQVLTDKGRQLALSAMSP